MPIKELSYLLGSNQNVKISELQSGHILILTDEMQMNLLKSHKKMCIYGKVEVVDRDEIGMDLSIRENGMYVDKRVVLYGQAVNEELGDLFSRTIDGIHTEIFWSNK